MFAPGDLLRVRNQGALSDGELVLVRSLGWQARGKRQWYFVLNHEGHVDYFNEEQLELISRCM